MLRFVEDIVFVLDNVQFEETTGLCTVHQQKAQEDDQQKVAEWIAFGLSGSLDGVE